MQRIPLYLLLAFLPAACGQIRPDSLPDPRPVRTMTFNIRYGTAPDGPNAWEERREFVASVLVDEDPEILAVQEALDFQVDWLIARFPQYRVVGSHRDGGRRGEFSGLFVDQRRFELIESDEFWFSETPWSAGSKSWDAAFARICVEARVRDRLDGRHWLFFATHLDHQGATARSESARMIVERIDAARDRGFRRILVLGDLNATEDAPPLALLEAANLRDTFRFVRPNARVVGTYHGFRGDPDGAKIDYILATPRVEVFAADIVRTAFERRYPSDHYPVTALVGARAKDE